MKRILVINFTRMGDIVQTTPLITGLQRKWVRAEIDLLVMAGFHNIAAMVPDVNRILLWDQDESVSGIVRGDSLAAIYRYHRDFADELCQQEYDLIINVTHSKESAILLRLLHGNEKRGVVLDELGRRLPAHPWIEYFFNVTANRGFNDFNLVDIYRRIGDLTAGEGGELGLQVPAAAVEKAQQLLSDLEPKRRFLVALQPGANRDNRRWPVDRFAELSRRLYLEQDAALVLVGSQDERELTERVVEAAGVPLLNLAGQTEVAQLAAVLQQCDLLVSNDTGSMHIAAAMGTPTVALFLATALPYETCAYTTDTIILQPALDCAPCSHHVECPHQRCRQVIGIGDVLQAIQKIRGDETTFTNDKVRLFRPLFNRDGMLQLRLLSRESLSVEQLTTIAYRLLWKKLLDVIPASDQAEKSCYMQLLAEIPEQLDILKNYDPPTEPDRLVATVNDHCEVLIQVEELGHRGFRAASRLSSTLDPVQLQEVVTEITDLDGELFRLEMQHEFIRPICVLYRFNRENMHSDDMDYLAREGKKMYRTVEVRARLLAALLRELLQRFDWARATILPAEDTNYA